MTTIHDIDGNHVAYSKGAPEKILRICDKTNNKNLSKEGKEKIEVSALQINELMEKNNNLMEKFILREKKKNEWDPLFILMVLFVAGALGILSSFVNFEVFTKYNF